MELGGLALGLWWVVVGWFGLGVGVRLWWGLWSVVVGWFGVGWG